MRAFYYSIIFDYVIMVTRFVGSRGYYRVGICLVSGRVGIIRIVFGRCGKVFGIG